MKTVNKTLMLIAIVINADGSGILQAESSDFNESGIYKQSKNGIARLVSQSNCSSPAHLSALVKLGGAKVTMDMEFRKEGEPWKSKDGLNSGTYTKDHYNPNNAVISFGVAANDRLLNAIENESAKTNAFAQLFATQFGVTATAPAKDEVVVDSVAAELDAAE